MKASETPDEPSTSAMTRHRGTIGATVALVALGYLAYAVWHGLADTAAELASFRWSLYIPVLALTCVNYGLRYVKWNRLIAQVGVHIAPRPSALIFLAGLGMVISPGKAGELIKPWLVREITGTPMIRTIPALVTERMTDGIAVVLLAALGVGTFLPDSTGLIVATLAGSAAFIALASSATLGDASVALLRRLPGLSGITHRVDEALRAMRSCLTPGELLIALGLSLVAWWAECVGAWLVFLGMGAEATLEQSTFLYAFATVFGAPSPGGLGMADVALVEGAVRLLGHITEPQALAAALLIRVATLWFGVVLGALTILRVDDLIRSGRESYRITTPPAAPSAQATPGEPP